MSIPHSNTACEKVFSKVNPIKTRERNKLIANTINAWLLSSECVKAAGGCGSFCQTQTMLSRFTKASRYPEKSNDAFEVETDDLSTYLCTK